MTGKTATIELPEAYLASLDGRYCVTHSDREGLAQYAAAHKESAYYDALDAGLARLEQRFQAARADVEAGVLALYRDPTSQHADTLLAKTIELHQLRGAIDQLHNFTIGWVAPLDVGRARAVALDHGRRARIDRVNLWAAQVLAQLRAGQALGQPVEDPTGGLGIDGITEALAGWRSPGQRQADLAQLRDRELALTSGVEHVDAETGQVDSTGDGLHLPAVGIAVGDRGTRTPIRQTDVVAPQNH